MGFALKAALVPFHAWLPDAHPSAPAPISAMLSGLLIKACGVYVLCRLVFSVFAGPEAFGIILVVLGTLSMVLGALLAVGQADLKRLLAYSSISQVGYVVLAIGTGVVALAWAPAHPVLIPVAGLALFGGLFHMANHAVFKSLLFLCSGSVEQATGTRLLAELGGLGRRMPVTAWSLRAGALAISGVPPFGGFWSKLIIIIVLVQMAVAGHWTFYLPAGLAVATAVVTLVYYAKVQRYVLGGEPSDRTARAREVPFAMCFSSVVLAVLCLASALLLLPPVRERLVDPAVAVLKAAVFQPAASAAEPSTVALDAAGRVP
jgi:multicomponent Na+:H+ antiporter subunit D